MSRRGAVILIGLALLSGVARADTPLRPPETIRVCGRGIAFCAELNPATDTVVFRIGPRFVATELYRIPGWHRSAFLSADGVYFASGYSGLNLLAPDDAVPETVVLTIWKSGEPLMKVTLGQVLRSMTALERTVSHYHWGNNLGFGWDNRFEIKTVEGLRVVVDPSTKSVKIDG